jgi:hypothetical protein
MNKAGNWLNKCLTTIEPERSSLHVLSLLNTLAGEWREIEDTQRITWEYFRSIKDAQAYIKKLGPWRIE